MSLTLTELKQDFTGELLSPGDTHYDEVRKVWNGMFDRRPAVIARCRSAADVVKAVNFARREKLVLAIKCGGHNSAGTGVCEGGVMVDLSLMNQVRVDAKAQTVMVEGGALWADVDKETTVHGWAVPAGVISHTGVGGLTLGGGFGWISRKHGLTVDNLLSAEVVTADGRIVTANDKENADLFWALRGGGGNFGVVTCFTFRAATIGKEVSAGLIVKRFEDAKSYIAFHREYVRTLPDEMTVWMIVRQAPSLPFLPSDIHGKLVVVVPFVWLGDSGKMDGLINPIRQASQSHGEHVGQVPWVNWQQGFDSLVPHGARNYWKSHQIKELSDSCIDRIIEFAGKMPSSECEVFIPHMEGVAGRVPEDATAFVHRKAPFVINIHTRWQKKEDDAKCLAWARDFHKATEPFASGVYVNFLSDEGEARVRQAYSPSVWDRLVAVKTKWDPENVFRINQNIKPSGKQ